MAGNPAEKYATPEKNTTPAEKYASPPSPPKLEAKNLQHPGITNEERFVYQNLSEKDPVGSLRWLQSRHPDIEISQNENGEVIATSRPGPYISQAGPVPQKLEPSGIMASLRNPGEAVKDITDVTSDLVKGAGATAGGVAGAALAGPAGAPAGAGITSSALDYLQQGLAKHYGLRSDNPNVRQAVESGLPDAVLTSILGPAGGPAKAALEESGAPGFLKKKIAKAATAVSGVPEKDLLHYQAHQEAIDALSKNPTGRLEAVKGQLEQLTEGISKKDKEISDGYTQAISKISQTPIDLAPAKQKVLDVKIELQKMKAANPGLDWLEPKIQEVDGIIDQYFSTGTLTGDAAYALKKNLDDISQVRKRNPVVGNVDYSSNPQLRGALRGASSEINKAIQSTSTEFTEVNKAFAENLRLKKELKKSLSDVGKAESKIQSRGVYNPSSSTYDLLRRADIAYGTNLVNTGRDLSAERYLGKPGLLGLSTENVTATARRGLGASLGGTLGGGAGWALGLDPVQSALLAGAGATAGSVLTGPAAQKRYIQGVNLLGKSGAAIPVSAWHLMNKKE